MTRRRPAIAVTSLVALSLSWAAPASVHADASGAPLLPYGSAGPVGPKVVHFVTDRTVSLIVAELGREQDVIRRTTLVTDLGLCNKPASVDALVSLLGDGSPLIRSTAVRSLRTLKAESHWPAIAKLAGDADPAVRLEVMAAAQALGTGEDVLVNGLEDADPAVRAAAAAVSISEGTDRALAAKLADWSPVLQATGARALAGRKSAATASAVKPLLESPSVLVRVAAVDTVAADGQMDRGQVESQFRHAHPAVRTAAARAIAALPTPSDQLAVGLAVLKDADLAVRVPAARALGKLGDESIVEPLVAQLDAGYEPLREAARASLAESAEAHPTVRAALLPKLVPMLTHATAGRREDASYLLGHLKAGEGFDAHVKLLQDPDWLVVNQAARSLGLIGNPAAGEALVAAMNRAIDLNSGGELTYYQAHARGKAGESAVLSAAVLKHEPILAATKPHLPNKRGPEQVRAAGFWALGALTSGDAAAAAIRAVMGRTTDPEESPAVIVEAIKAAGNARVTSLRPQLERMARDQADEYGRAAHDALNRIDGKQTPFALPDALQPAPTSIQDITPAAN